MKTLCERCGGMGKEPEGHWTGKTYDSVAGGPCTLCGGSGYLSGESKTLEQFRQTKEVKQTKGGVQ